MEIMDGIRCCNGALLLYDIKMTEITPEAAYVQYLTATVPRSLALRAFTLGIN